MIIPLLKMEYLHKHKRKAALNIQVWAGWNSCRLLAHLCFLKPIFLCLKYCQCEIKKGELGTCMFPPQRQKCWSPLQQDCCQNSSADLHFICNASIVCAALFWHYPHCVCVDATSPAHLNEMLQSSVTLGLLCISQLMLFCVETAVSWSN